MKKTHKFLALVVILIAIASFFLWRETHISVSSPPTAPPTAKTTTHATAPPSPTPISPSTHVIAPPSPTPSPTHTVSTPVSNNPYFLRFSGTPTQDERVTSAAECKAALGFMGIKANNVTEVNDIVQAPGCFFNNLSAGSGTPLAYYNKNVDTSRSGFCTPNPGYAVCVVRKFV